MDYTKYRTGHFDGCWTLMMVWHLAATQICYKLLSDCRSLSCGTRAAALFVGGYWLARSPPPLIWSCTRTRIDTHSFIQSTEHQLNESASVSFSTCPSSLISHHCKFDHLYYISLLFILYIAIFFLIKAYPCIFFKFLLWLWNSGQWNKKWSD